MRTAGSRKKKPAEAELNVQLLLMAATAFYLLPPLLCLVAGFAQGWPGFAHEQMFSECDLQAKLDEERNAHALESARFFFKRIRLRRRKRFCAAGQNEFRLLLRAMTKIAHVGARNGTEIRLASCCGGSAKQRRTQ